MVSDDAINNRYDEIQKFVMGVLERGANDSNFSYIDAAKLLIDKPAAAVIIALLLRDTTDEESVAAFLTALIHEEILQNPSPLPVVRQLGRLH